jgi:hypothetical protein
MERTGPSFFESDDEEQDLNAVEITPPTPEELPEEPNFLDRVKEIMGIEDDDDDEEEDDGTPNKKKKKGFFKRMFGVATGANVEKPEPLPPAEETPAEVEPAFALPFLQAPELEADPLVQPHHQETEVVTPEEPLFDIESDAETTDETAPANPEAEAEAYILDLQEQILQQHQAHEILNQDIYDTDPEEAPDTPAESNTVEATPAADEAPEGSTIGTGQSSHSPEAGGLTPQESIHPPQSPESFAAILARNRAKERHDRKLEKEVTQKVDKKLSKRFKKQLEAYKHRSSAERAQPIQPVAASQVEHRRPSTHGIEAARPVHTQPTVERHVAQPPGAREVYRPEVHDEVPPEVAFQQLTGIEQPGYRSLEAERRFEVKDDPTKVPAAYTQTHQPTPGKPVFAQPPTPTHQDDFTNLGSTPPMPPTQKSKTPQPYTTAMVSGVATAVVILAILIILAIIF